MPCHPPITKGLTASFLVCVGHPPAPFRSAQIYVIASDLGDMAAPDQTLDPSPLTASSRLMVPVSGKWGILMARAAQLLGKAGS